MPTANKRVHTRAPLKRRCWCESGSITIYAQIGNVSEGGLFVKTFAPLTEGVRTRVRWDFGEDDGEVEAEAVVVWRRPNGHGTAAPSGMGLKFESIASDGLARIRRYVEAAAAAGDAPTGDGSA